MFGGGKLGFSGFKRFSDVICLPFVLFACEAPLDMQGVEKSLVESVRRTDVIQDVVVLPNQTAIFVGGDGLVIEHAADAQNIHRSQLGSFGEYPSLIDITICPDNSVYALSLDGDVWAREAQGNWLARPVDTEETLQAIECAPDGKLWLAASFSTLFKSENKGVSWQDFSTYEDAFLTELDFVNQNTGFAVGEFGTLMKTTNAGETWDNLASTPYDFYPLSSFFLDEQTGWVGGLNGDILKTSDGGLSWSNEKVNSEAPIYRIQEIAGEVYAIGNSGTFLRYAKDAWVTANIGINTFGYLRAIAGNENAIYLGGQALATKISMTNSPNQTTKINE